MRGFLSPVYRRRLIPGPMKNLTVLGGGRGRRGWRQALYSESTILYMGLMRANVSSNLVRPENFFKIDIFMKW
jgi:hypothetical protein